jgi:SAM-dependent methyltransferase
VNVRQGIFKSERLKGFVKIKGKLSTQNLRRLCENNKTEEEVLVIHSEDVPYADYFPNAFTVTKRKKKQADLHVDRFYRDIAGFEKEKYRTIICTGLLEHVPDPQRLIDDIYELLPPGGKLVLSASSVFSIHEGPDDYFHFTPFGIRKLMQNWTKVEVYASSQPFETIGILLQRIILQCEIRSKAIKILISILAKQVYRFDKYISAQYYTRSPKNDRTRIDSMLPSNIFVEAVK